MADKNGPKEKNLRMPILINWVILMKLQKRRLTGREKNEESIRLLERLMEKLYSDNSSIARRAAFNLSWMQDDGLDILRQVLFSDVGRKSKSAAAYGLRNMHGRMKKDAREVLEKGLQSSNRNTQKASQNALDLLDGKVIPKFTRNKKRNKFNIKEIPNRIGQANKGQRSVHSEHFPSNRRFTKR